MPDFFKNPNANSVVVSRVPCAFAKAQRGNTGTHYTVVIFDKKYNVMYVGSECEHLHGDAVQGMHELGGNTCFAVTQSFRTALGKVKATKREVLDRAGKIEGPTLLQAAFTASWEHMTKVHNSRVAREKPEVDLKLDGFQNLINRLTGNMLDLPHVLESKPNLVSEKKVFPELFKVVSKVYPHGYTQGSQEFPPGVYYELLAADEATYTPFAVRASGGSNWVVNEDRIKQYARHNHSSVADTSSWSRNGLSRDRCVFCSSSYERMSKHTNGAKHMTRVIEIVKLVCKATSSTGLRMINNPRHRSAFFRNATTPVKDVR